LLLSDGAALKAPRLGFLKPNCGAPARIASTTFYWHMAKATLWPREPFPIHST